MKAIAMYLPQYYRVKENDEWWGDGYTDWTAMCRARPLFEGHKQPKMPMDNYMYDLMQKETMLWQAGLMKKFGVYGLCFYHYWFKNGRRILEKPAENLHIWKDVDMPFCFCWANAGWSRSWSNIPNQGARTWTEVYEKGEASGNGILMEQSYGDEKEWIEHFEYLCPFFQDERYIKKGNKPVFLTYDTRYILCMDEMLQCWNRLAVKNGFDGIYVIGAGCGGKDIESLDAYLVMEPNTVFCSVFRAKTADKEQQGTTKIIAYEDFCEKSLSYTLQKNKTVYYSGMTCYDDTPRRGKNGIVVINDHPEKFKVYLTKLYAKNAVLKNEYVFINAWNEWGEGMHLEPDQEFGYGYLQAIPYAEQHYREELYR